MSGQSQDPYHHIGWYNEETGNWDKSEPSLPAFFTWSCMVCKAERPDDRISVAHHVTPGFEAQFPDTRTNIRYCNDNPECARIAHDPDLWEYVTLKEQS